MGMSRKGSCSSSNISLRNPDLWSVSDTECSDGTQVSSKSTLSRKSATSHKSMIPYSISNGVKSDVALSEAGTALDTNYQQRMDNIEFSNAHADNTKVNERTPLLQGSHEAANHGKTIDVEAQSPDRTQDCSWTWSIFTDHAHNIGRTLLHPQAWKSRATWSQLIVRPTTLLPAVFVGVLLNILDALSYGMILFPLGQPIFDSLGAEGISVFYVSTIISQLVYSAGGSAFCGGVGSEMIEVIPFFHKMALMILAKVGESNPKAVLATTILAYALSSIMTGVMFFLMGIFRLGSLTVYFPQHILTGCIGGVGWFLIVTAMKVSTRSQNNLQWRNLFAGDTAPLWMIPLSLAIFLVMLQRYIKSSILVGGYFVTVTAMFYLTTAYAGIPLTTLRHYKWVFEATPGNDHLWYHFYTLYDFRQVNWAALMSTVPTMLALTFFGVLHVPINIPALSISTGKEDVIVDRELIAHGVSNCLSGLCGSVQNYLVFANSLLFMQSGGNDRLAGLMLAAATLGILLAGFAVSIIGYVPIMVVGALIFLLGIELLSEALLSTFKKVNYLEYITIVAVIIASGLWDFTIGILLGIVLAALHALTHIGQHPVIQATFSGTDIRSIRKRSPEQLRRLREMRRQINVIKLSGVLFFGTIPSVENHIRSLLEEDKSNSASQPLSSLILDLTGVSKIDFSAAEGLVRARMLLDRHDVQYIISGLRADSKVSHALKRVGLIECESGVSLFENIEEALGHCEDQFLNAH